MRERRNGGVGVFAVCFGRRSDTAAWVETIEMLGQEGGLHCEARGVEVVKPGLRVVWFRFRESSVEARL